jgi:hypothetical protein
MIYLLGAVFAAAALFSAVILLTWVICFFTADGPTKTNWNRVFGFFLVLVGSLSGLTFIFG